MASVATTTARMVAKTRPKTFNVSAKVTTLADNETRWKSRLMIAAGVALITYLVFALGLGMVLPTWPWSP
jgi:uncharacterized membrane protein YkvA (DUF1232 family)